MPMTLWLALTAALAACGPPQSPASSQGAPAPRAELALRSPRAAHASVTLPDGRVALIGGCVVDGCEPGPASRTVEIFDPQSGEMREAGALEAARIGAGAAALPDGRILIVGGWDGPAVTAAAELFDPATGRSVKLPSLSAPRASAAVAVLGDGSVLIAGGYDGEGALDSAEIFRPATGDFVPAGRLRQGRSGATAVRLADGRVLVAGGGVGQGRQIATATAELYDPATGAFTRTGDLAARRYKHAAVPLQDGRVLVVGGADERDYSGKLRTLEAYDLATGRFSPAGVMNEARFKVPDAVVVLRDGRVLIAGGAPRPEIYDPRTGAVRELDVDLGAAWSFMTAALLADGRVFLAGGYREGRIDVSGRAWLLTVQGAA